MDDIQNAIGVMMAMTTINSIIHEQVNEDSKLVQGVKIEELELVPILVVFSIN